jgi:3-phosphoshikimate 1-carboxyvinyltransferase
MIMDFKSGRRLEGIITVPGDKSIAHRAVMLAGIADGTTRVRNFPAAKDPWSTVECARALGVKIEDRGNGVLDIYGTGPDGLSEPEDVLYAGNSGTTMRLLSGILAGQSFYSVITGDSSLRRRPMGRIAEPLRQMGAQISGRAGGNFAPLSITGGRLKGTYNRLKVASAQVKSSILLAGIFAEGRTVVAEPGSSRDHTERLLNRMGVPVTKEGNIVSIDGGHWPSAIDIDIPGDFSSAAFLIVAATIVDGSRLRIRNVGINPTRTGLLKVLAEMGADITLEHTKDAAGEPVADIVVCSKRLKGIEIGGEIIPTMIDEIPVLAVAASLADGRTVIRDASELKVKESDRISAITRELSRMGASINELHDGLEITGKDCLLGAECHSHNDHRIAMALAVAGVAARGTTFVEGWECVDISFPEFAEKLKGTLSE